MGQRSEQNGSIVETMKEIASRLGISARTAESYKYDIMSDLGVESTAELIQYAVKLGLTKM